MPPKRKAVPPLKAGYLGKTAPKQHFQPNRFQQNLQPSITRRTNARNRARRSRR